MTGNELSNTLIGNAGVNFLVGRGGADVMSGFLGNDRYVVDTALDRANEAVGQGSDRVYALSNYVLPAGSEIEKLTTINPTSTYAVSFVGNAFANTIEGNAAANPLNSAGGSDTLTGFGGSDTFRFTTALGPSNVDKITDFSVLADTIHLENAVFTGVPAGGLNADAFHTGAAAADAEDRIIYNKTTGALIFDTNGNAPGGAIQFAKLATGLALTSADFVVI